MMTFDKIEEKSLTVIYPCQSDEKPGNVDFYALLSFLELNEISYEWLSFNVDAIESEQVKNKLEGIKNKMVYLYIVNICYLYKLNRFLPLLKKNNSLIILGGAEPMISANSDETPDMFKDVDIITRAPEEEKVLVTLLKKIFLNADWTRIKGITTRIPGNEKNRIVVNKNQPLSKNLNHLDSLGIYKQKIPAGEWYPIITSRGCGYNCQYCNFQAPYRLDYKGKTNYWRTKSEKKIVDEMEFLLSKGIDKFVFHCHQFFAPKQDNDQVAINIAREILERKIKLKFKFSAKPPEIKRNFNSFYILNQAGMAEINIGIDSGIQRFITMFDCGSNEADTIEVLKFMHEQQYNFDIGFIFYDPFLNVEEIKENLAFLKRIAKYFSHLYLPYSGYLDSRILNRTLILRHGMPIIRQLKTRGIIVESPGFSEPPAAKFIDPQVMYIYSIYRLVNQHFLPKIRRFFYDKSLVQKYDFINTFPLRLVEQIISTVVEKKFTHPEDYVLHFETYIKKVFNAEIESIFSDFSMYRNDNLNKWLRS